MVAAATVVPGRLAARLLAGGEVSHPLEQFEYGDVTLASELHEKQLRETHAVLMDLSEDSLLKPLRQMSGLPAPGADLGGWYGYNPHYKVNVDDEGFAPGCRRCGNARESAAIEPSLCADDFRAVLRHQSFSDLLL
jgi:hypothetical protein